LRPTEERSIHGYWDGGDDRPDPLVAQSAPEFVAQLRTLVQWSGLDLEEIEQLARANGDILPPSIVSAALSHNTLPPEEVVVALVAAIGDDDEMVELWASVLWRLEELEAATITAPHSAPMMPPMPPPMAPVSSVTGSRHYTGSALEQAVQKRRNKDSWTGLHRSFQKGLRATGFGSKIGRWPAPVAIGVAFLIFVGGVGWALMGGGPDGDKATEPRANPCCVAGSGGPGASASPEGEASPSEMPVVIPFPSGSTKPSPTPKPSPTRNSPTPTQTQTQLNPQLSGSANGECGDNGTDRYVDLSVTANLTGAPAGNNPQGQAGKPGDLQPLNTSGGPTSFRGTIRVVVGALPAAATGSIDWNVTVTVDGVPEPVRASGSRNYDCS